MLTHEKWKFPDLIIFPFEKMEVSQEIEHPDMTRVKLVSPGEKLYPVGYALE